MKVILIQDVKGTGKKNQLVEVSDGYARNFLFKRNLAIPADAKNLNIMKDRLLSEDAKKDRELAEANSVKERLEGKSIQIFVNAGDSGKLFGSITSKDISETLKAQLGADLDKRKIQLNEPIKSIGQTKVNIRLHADVTAVITVDVQEKQ